MPWIKIPAATITFSGKAAVKEPDNIPADVITAVYQGIDITDEFKSTSVIIEVTPVKEFITYGVGASLMTMRKPEKARGCVPVAE